MDYSEREQSAKMIDDKIKCQRDLDNWIYEHISKVMHFYRVRIHINYLTQDSRKHCIYKPVGET